MARAFSGSMDSEGHEYPEVSLEEENEYCTVCHTVYTSAEGCWCVESGMSHGNELDKARA